jgi:hypothetical protein
VSFRIYSLSLFPSLTRSRREFFYPLSNISHGPGSPKAPLPPLSPVFLSPHRRRTKVGSSHPLSSCALVFFCTHAQHPFSISLSPFLYLSSNYSLALSLSRLLARSFTLAHTHTLTPPPRHPLRQHPTPARGQLWRSSSWPQLYPPSFRRTGWGGSIWWGLAS